MPHQQANGCYIKTATLTWVLFDKVNLHSRLGGSHMEQFNITMRKYLKEVGVTAQQAIERVVREEKLAGKGKLKVKMVLTGEGTNLRHVVEGEIDLADAHDT